MKPLDAISQMQIEESERRVAAQVLHDTICADLTNLTLAAEIVLRTMDVNPAGAKEALFRLREAAVSTKSALRFAQRGMMTAPVTRFIR